MRCKAHSSWQAKMGHPNRPTISNWDAGAWGGDGDVVVVKNDEMAVVLTLPALSVATHHGVIVMLGTAVKYEFAHGLVIRFVCTRNQRFHLPDNGHESLHAGNTFLPTLV